MKVIDLLNKIANGEEVPKKVKAGYYYYEYEEKGEYINVDDTEDLLFDFDSYFPLEQSLNQDIEIIKEDKKIEKIKILNCDNYVKKENYETILTMQEIALDIQTLRHKLDEIIDYLEEKDNEQR